MGSFFIRNKAVYNNVHFYMLEDDAFPQLDERTNIILTY
jgi:hypothetical protein